MSDRLDNNGSLILASGERSRMIQRHARDSQDKRRAGNEKKFASIPSAHSHRLSSESGTRYCIITAF